MKKEEVKQVGFTTKLVVKEDCVSARGFGKNKHLKKGDYLICHKVEENKENEDYMFKVLTEDEEEIFVFYDQVEIAEKRYSIENLKEIKKFDDIYKGMELIIVGENSELGLGSKVIAEGDVSYIGRQISVKTEYDGDYFYNQKWVSVSELRIPNNVNTKTKLIKNLINFIEKDEKLLSKEQILVMLKEME